MAELPRLGSLLPVGLTRSITGTLPELGRRHAAGPVLEVGGRAQGQVLALLLEADQAGDWPNLQPATCRAF